MLRHVMPYIKLSRRNHLPPCSDPMLDLSLLWTSLLYKRLCNVRFESSTDVKIKTRVCSDVTPCILVERCQKCCLWRSTRFVSIKVHSVTSQATVILKSKNVLHVLRSRLHIPGLFLNPVYAWVTTCFVSDNVSKAVTRKKMLYHIL